MFLKSFLILIVAIIVGLLVLVPIQIDDVSNEVIEIDVVVPWCNGTKGEQYDSSRRDQGTLKFVFRSIEKYIPWIRNVYLIVHGN